MGVDAEERAAALAGWVESVVGVPVTLTRVPGGGRHEAWQVAGPGGTAWFMKADAAPPPPHEHCTLRREADLYRAAAAAGAPVPAILGVHPDLEAVLMERMPGSAAYAPLPDAAKTEIADDLAEVLARMHAAAPATLAPWVDPNGTMLDHVRRELDAWEQRFVATRVPDPVIAACFTWLRDHLPDTGAAPASLVQGDTGPGNLLHDGARVTALLDFELAHLGDPMEDLAWVGTRNAQEPIPDIARFLDRYAAGGGAPPDLPRLRYHSLFAELRIAVLGVQRSPGPGSLLGEHGNHLIYGALHRRLTVEALAAALGVPMPEVPLPGGADTRNTGYYDGILAQLAQVVVPAVDEPLAKRQSKSIVRVVKYLREVDRIGDAHDRAELDDLAGLLGHRPADVAAGAAELHGLVVARRVGAADLLPYAAAQVMRRQQLLAASMGALAHRHLPTYGS